MEDWPGCQDPAQLGQNVERVAPVNVRPTPERDTANSWILAGGTTRSLPRFLRASTSKNANEMVERDSEEFFNELYRSDVEIDSLSKDSYKLDIRPPKQQICKTCCVPFAYCNNLQHANGKCLHVAAFEIKWTTRFKAKPVSFHFSKSHHEYIFEHQWKLLHISGSERDYAQR
ncbi:unnamed protein product [Heterotrigona itama]|uniref:Uncharacterized protein n=1 Tax=Heterotrigona itama TaxID=395501 RepID=A0A6V7HGD1_9HYME|nr:unnamed protein product [Heterotrigona itama]